MGRFERLYNPGGECRLLTKYMPYIKIVEESII
jgi:hypothetical protein